MTATTPILLVGRTGQPRLLSVAGTGFVDDDIAYEMLALSRSVAPAGPGGECMFTLLYLTTIHYSEDVSVWVTPIIDGTALDTQRIDLTGLPDSRGERETHELSLSIPYTVAGIERLRTAPRGTWFEVQIETKYGDAEAGAAAQAAKQVVESVEVEYEVVRETKASE